VTQSAHLSVSKWRAETEAVDLVRFVQELGLASP
jgi:hypothetical protein